MRSASSYRGAKKKAARAAGVPFGAFNDHYQRSRVFAAVELERKALAASPEAARRVLGIWAGTGGRVTAVSPAATNADLEAMNVQSVTEISPKAAEAAAKKITAGDVDKAMEAALTRWQAERRQGPLPLSALFAARARALGWVEHVEFEEDRR